jgi:hypothetical protein
MIPQSKTASVGFRQNQGKTPNVNHERALRLAVLGYKVFPCREKAVIDPATGKEKRKAKEPYTTHGFKDASCDLAQIRSWWSCWPNALVGLATGAENRLAVIDLDRKNGADGFASLDCIGLDVPSPVTRKTPTGGGEHRYFRHPGRDVRTRSNLLQTLTGRERTGIDVRGDGGYVIVWDDLAGAALENFPPWPDPPWPEAFDDALRRDEIERNARFERPRAHYRNGSAPPDLDRIRDALSCIPADDHFVWISIGMALKAELADAGEAIWTEWSRTSKKFDARDQAKRWRSFKGGGVTIGTLFHHAKMNGWRAGIGTAKNAKNGGTPATPATNGVRFTDDPLPLFRELPKAEAFPIEALGETLGGWRRRCKRPPCEARWRSAEPPCSLPPLAPRKPCATSSFPSASGNKSP